MTVGSLLDRIEKFEVPRNIPIRIAFGDKEWEIDLADYEMFGYRDRGLILHAKSEPGQLIRRRRLSSGYGTRKEGIQAHSPAASETPDKKASKG